MFLFFKVFAGIATLLLPQHCLIRLGSHSTLIKLAGLSSLHLPHQARQAYHGRQPQHSSYEPKVASSDLVKLDEASQLVPADVQQALLKAYEEAAAEEE